MEIENDIRERLRTGVVLLDGGLATSLQARGLPVGAPPESWNLERPEQVQAVHEAFLGAGAAVIQTNSFGGNAAALERHALKRRGLEVNRAAARLALAARDALGGGLVAGSVGPTGHFFDAHCGEVDPGVGQQFRRQIEVLAGEGVDYLSLETFTDPDEALVVVEVVRELTDLPFTLCFTFDQVDGEPRTPSGETLGYCLITAAEAGACGVGLNCSIGSQAMLEVAPPLLDDLEVPLIVKPNAGLPELAAGRPVYPEEPEEFADRLVRLAELGARGVGGCCGCDADFIAALRRALAAASG